MKLNQAFLLVISALLIGHVALAQIQTKQAIAPTIQPLPRIQIEKPALAPVATQPAPAPVPAPTSIDKPRISSTVRTTAPVNPSPVPLVKPAAINPTPTRTYPAKTIMTNTLPVPKPITTPLPLQNPVQAPKPGSQIISKPGLYPQIPVQGKTPQDSGQIKPLETQKPMEPIEMKPTKATPLERGPSLDDLQKLRDSPKQEKIREIKDQVISKRLESIPLEKMDAAQQKEAIREIRKEVREEMTKEKPMLDEIKQTKSHQTEKEFSENMIDELDLARLGISRQKFKEASQKMEKARTLREAGRTQEAQNLSNEAAVEMPIIEKKLRSEKKISFADGAKDQFTQKLKKRKNPEVTVRKEIIALKYGEKSIDKSRFVLSFDISEKGGSGELVATIPKEIAEKVDDIDFEDPPDAILQDDPVVKWVMKDVPQAETIDYAFTVDKDVQNFDILAAAAEEQPSAAKGVIATLLTWITSLFS